ncbi:MAG: isocitrate/isopropylmalate family dehydrogenase [Pseudomonadota bacterium]
MREKQTRMNSSFSITVLPGDGIGLEVTPAALTVAKAALAKTGGPALTLDEHDIGAGAYQRTGTDFSDEAKAACQSADAIYLGAAGLPHVRKSDGTEITPQIDLRFLLGLYAGVRPTRAIPGVPTPLASPRAAEIDFTLVRESTEGLFASIGKGYVENDETAHDFMIITRKTSEDVIGFSFAEARRRGKSAPKVTLIDKANVFVSFAFMRKIFDEIAQKHPDVASERLYVDASTLWFLARPWDFDVIVTENMFGDILSDLAAGLVGGMGYAPSGDIGNNHAVFQPAHGSAPDIAGSGKANPTAAILSAAMMLDWLGTRHDVPSMVDAGTLIHRAVDVAFGSGSLLTCELVGASGVKEVTNGVLDALKAG